MSVVELAKVSVIVADPDHQALHLLKEILITTGFRKIELGTSLQFLTDSVRQGMPDLLISETTLPDGDFCEFVSDLRHHLFGNNPFLAIKALTRNPTPELVKKVIMAGADDLLTKPTNPQKLMERVGRIIHRRKPFIVTSDYVGPVRPALSQKEANARKFDVPNTLKAKAESNMSDDAVQFMVKQAVNEVNIERLEAHAEHIDDLIGMVLPRLDSTQLDATTRLCLDRLIYVTEDAGRRLGGTKYDHVSDLSQTLFKVATSLRNCGGEPGVKDVALLEPLNKAIQLGFKKGADVAAARQISAAVKP